MQQCGCSWPNKSWQELNNWQKILPMAEIEFIWNFPWPSHKFMAATNLSINIRRLARPRPRQPTHINDTEIAFWIVHRKLLAAQQTKISRTNSALWANIPVHPIPLHKNGHNSYVFWANWKISVPKTIYCSRPSSWYSQKTRDTCHVSRNVSQSFLTFGSKISKRRTYLIWLTMRSSYMPSWPSKNICHPSGGIF